jgi:hypothetical protein
MTSPSVYQGLLAAVLFLTFAGPSWAEQPAPPLLEPEAMAARIDQLIAARWQEKGVTPAPRASDAEFFRRLSLDINGRIPTIVDLIDFLDDTNPNKRRAWVERLFAKRAPVAEDPNQLPYYVSHFTNYWRSVLFSQTTNQQAAFFIYQLDPWLRKHLMENTPYDKMVFELLTTPQGQSFFQANEGKPENLASNTSRLFLGVKLECAQCHDDRSGGSWTREQFWEYAAFFSNFTPGRFGQFQQQQGGGGPAKIKIPDKNVVVEAKFLDGKQPQWRAGTSPQIILGEWLTSRDNPYFARAAANRMWYYFLGTGLVDPVDQMATEENPPSHPEIVDELAYQFAGHGFDLKYLIRVITSTQAYQLTSVQTHESQEDTRLFSRMAVRGLSPEQLFDSILLATGSKGPPPGPNMGRVFPGQPGNPRQEFIAKFSNNDRRTERQTSILQALYLMNSKWMADQVERPGGNLDLIAAAETRLNGEKVTVAGRITDLYVISLSRKPTPQELERMVKYVDSAPGGDTKKALADIFWALLNSAEFLLNH